MQPNEPKSEIKRLMTLDHDPRRTHVHTDLIMLFERTLLHTAAMASRNKAMLKEGLQFFQGLPQEPNLWVTMQHPMSAAALTTALWGLHYDPKHDRMTSVRETLGRIVWTISTRAILFEGLSA